MSLSWNLNFTWDLNNIQVQHIVTVTGKNIQDIVEEITVKNENTELQFFYFSIIYLAIILLILVFYLIKKKYKWSI